MATKFGRIDNSESSFEEQTFHKGQTLKSSSIGTHHIFGLKDHYKPGTSDAGGGLLSVSGSHWAFVHTMFYSSGSSKINTDEKDKFNNIYHNFNQYNDLKPFHTNKFYDSASIFYIPQATFGERIQPGSFQLTGRTGSYTTATKEIIIKDDNNGNLYSSNSAHSQSAASSISSSDNYIGNIFYDLGMVVLTETASWSGSVGYFDIGHEKSHLHRTYNYWTLDFNSTTPFFVSQYSIKISSGEFNSTMNSTTKLYKGGNYIPSGSSVSDVANLRNELTGSGWKPYFNQIQLHRNQSEEPVFIANLPRAVKMRDDIDIIVTFRLDH
tara:strand:+ start:1067 stop:2038 length:972 start_codon:yes stop_codon:yes gene_type:complete